MCFCQYPSLQACSITPASQRNHCSEITIRYANVKLVFAWQDLYMNRVVIWFSFLYLCDTAGALSATQRRSPIRVTVNCHSQIAWVVNRGRGEETLLCWGYMQNKHRSNLQCCSLLKELKKKASQNLRIGLLVVIEGPTCLMPMNHKILNYKGTLWFIFTVWVRNRNVKKRMILTCGIVGLDVISELPSW